MTRKLFKNTMTALLALMVSGMLTCCINDEIVDTESLNSGEEYYMDFTFQSTSGSPLTRAGGTFVDGTHDEHDIGVKGNFALFFNKDKNFLLASDLRLKEHEEITNDNGEDNAPSADNKEEAIYRTRYFFRKDQEKNEAKMPKYVLVVLNGGNVEDVNSKYAEGTPMSQIFIDYLWKEEEDPSNRLGFYEENGTKFFTMSNSVYMGNDATEIKKENIQRFSEKYDPTKVTRVYVERMVSKFLYKEDNNKKDDEHTYKFDPKTEEITLFCGYDVKGKDADDPNDPGQIIVIDLTKSSRIVITGWGINALETRNYIFKNIDDTKSGWNIPGKYRYNWSVDPHYKYTHYPWQYRSAVENRKLRYYSDAENPSPLRNYSYTEFVNQTNQGNKFDREVYAPENTYDPTNGLCDEDSEYYLDNRTNLLAGTHLIVCAKFMTDFRELDNLDNKVYGDDIFYDYGAHDLYRDNTNIYYATQKHCLAELVRRMNYNLKSNTSMRYRYYNWGDKIDGDDGKEFAAKTAGGYQLYYNGEPFTYAKAMTLNDVQLETANVLNGDGKLLPWLENDKGTWDIKNSKGEPLKIYGSDYDYVQDEIYKTSGGEFGTEYEPIRKVATSDDVKSLMYEWMGAIDHFNEGKMYYAAPVLHIGADDPEKAKESELGHYGVVRNTWYKFNLDNVTTVGAPIDNPDDPIVPNKVTTYDKLRFTIEILPWHEIGTTITLPN